MTHHSRLIRTDAELFDLPPGAVIRTIGPAGNVGEVSEPRFDDLKSWEIDPNGEDRLIPRRVDWAGSEIPTYEYEHGEIARFLPAEVIWLPDIGRENMPADMPAERIWYEGYVAGYDEGNERNAGPIPVPVNPYSS